MKIKIISTCGIGQWQVVLAADKSGQIDSLIQKSKQLETYTIP